MKHLSTTSNCSAASPGAASGAQRLAALAAAVATVLAGTAYPQLSAAQAAPDSSAAEDQMLEIVVTARKRNESLAEVPTSITDFTAEALQDYNIQSFNDYATKTPNVSFSYGG